MIERYCQLNISIQAPGSNNQSVKSRSSRSSKNSFFYSYSENSRSIKAWGIKQKAKLTYLQANIKILEQRRKAKNQAKALKVNEEMLGVKARMEVYKSHYEVNAEETLIPTQMKKEALEFGRQLRKDAKKIKRMLLSMHKKSSVADYQYFQIGGMQMKNRLI